MLFACFPVCLTFVALGILALLIVATGMVGHGPGAGQPETGNEGAAPVYRGEGPTGPPPWWVVVLIFLAVAAAFFLMNWAGADW